MELETVEDELSRTVEWEHLTEGELARDEARIAAGRRVDLNVADGKRERLMQP